MIWASFARPAALGIARAPFSEEVRHEPFRILRRGCRVARRCLAAAGVVGFSTSGWIETLAADAAGRPAAAARSCILLWMTGGPSQIDTFDPKPGHANGGDVQGDRDRGAGHPDQRAPAQAGQADEGHRHHPLDEHEGGRPRPGDVQPAHRLPAAAGRSTTRPWARSWPRSWARTTPSCRTSSASRRSAASTRRRSAPGSSARSTPRWSSASAARSARRPTADAASFQVEDLRPAAGRGHDAGRRPPRPAGRAAPGLPVEPPRDRAGQPPGRLPAGRPADAVGGRQGVRAGGRAGRAPRRLRPQPVRPGLPAGPPAGRARRAVRRGHALRRSTGPWPSAGTPTSRTSRPSRSSARCSTRPGRP